MSDTKTSSDLYYDTNAYYGVHEDLLRDDVRTHMFLNTIEKNADYFVDKIVVDIGSGVGLFTMQALKAGAKHVYCVESAGITEILGRVLKDNGYENKTTIVKGVIGEDIKELTDKDGNKVIVDIIISEWMGYTLFSDNRIEEVIYARDNFFNQEKGIIIPDAAQLYLCAIEDEEYKREKFDYWDNVYGFNMSPLKEQSRHEPLIDTVETRQMISNPVGVINMNIMTVTYEELSFHCKFNMKIEQQQFCHGFVSFFNVQFASEHCNYLQGFTTGPHSNLKTHWKQTIFYFNEPVTVFKNDVLSGMISIKYETPKQATIVFSEVEVLKKGEEMDVRHEIADCTFKL